MCTTDDPVATLIFDEFREILASVQARYMAHSCFLFGAYALVARFTCFHEAIPHFQVLHTSLPQAHSTFLVEQEVKSKLDLDSPAFTSSQASAGFTSFLSNLDNTPLQLQTTTPSSISISLIETSIIFCLCLLPTPSTILSSTAICLDGRKQDCADRSGTFTFAQASLHQPKLYSPYHGTCFDSLPASHPCYSNIYIVLVDLAHSALTKHHFTIAQLEFCITYLKLRACFDLL